MTNKLSYTIACFIILCCITIIFSCFEGDELPNAVLQTGTATGTLTGTLTGTTTGTATGTSTGTTTGTSTGTTTGTVTGTSTGTTTGTSTGTTTGTGTGTATGTPNQPPTGQITSPTDSDCITNNPIVISGTADDDNTVSSIELKVNGATVATTGTTNWTGTSSTLTGIVHTIEVTVYDNEGSSSTPHVVNFELEFTSSDFKVNTYTTNEQETPSIAMDNNGNFVVTWQSNGQDNDASGVFAQRFDNNGTAVGSEFQVNTYTINDQQTPSIAMDNNGNFVITWASFEQDGSSNGIFAQRFNNSGTSVGSEFQVNSYTTINQINPSTAMNNSGNFVITWASYGQDGDRYGVFAQMFDNTGNSVGSEFQVNTYTSYNQWKPSITMGDTGDFVIAWESEDGQDGNGDGVFAQRFNNSGTAVGSEFQVNTFTSNGQGSPSIAMDNTGNFVITWISLFQDGGSYGVFAQRFNNSGTAVGSEFQVNTFTTSYQNTPSITMDNSGNFVITWRSNGQDGDGFGIYAQHYDNNGTVVGSEFQVNSYTLNDQSFPSIDMNDNGNLVIAWESNVQDGDLNGVYAKYFHWCQ